MSEAAAHLTNVWVGASLQQVLCDERGVGLGRKHERAPTVVILDVQGGGAVHKVEERLREGGREGGGREGGGGGRREGRREGGRE